MRSLLIAFAAVFVLSPPAVSAGIQQQERVLFGPVKYDVKERYGRDNRYKDGFKASEALSMIELQNGDANRAARSDFIELTLNGQKLVLEDKYDYGFLICIAGLHKENDFELLLKDARPGGSKRPKLSPKFVTMTVKSYAGKLPRGVYGVNSLDQLKGIADMADSIRNPESASLALSSINLQRNAHERAESMRKLADRKDISAQPFILSVFHDPMISPDLRGEAAVALGMLQDSGNIQALISGMLDPDEKIRLCCTKALSMFPEEGTREPLMKMLQGLDMMRMKAVADSIIKSGWKPVGTLLKLAESRDSLTSKTAINILGSTGDPRAADLLLKLLEDPGPRDVKTIITAVGETKDVRALALLAGMAADPLKRAGKEAELGEALASIGDPKTAGLIADMIDKADSRQTSMRLKTAYKRLTGKEYK